MVNCLAWSRSIAIDYPRESLPMQDVMSLEPIQFLIVPFERASKIDYHENL